jgi:hypothetical protein
MIMVIVIMMIMFMALRMLLMSTNVMQSGDSALMEAVRHGHAATAELLLRKGAACNRVNKVCKIYMWTMQLMLRCVGYVVY